MATNNNTRPAVNPLVEEAYKAIEGGVWGLEKRMRPTCSDDCQCFEIGMAQLHEKIGRLYSEIIIAIKMICTEREIPYNNDSLGKLFDEIQDRWIAEQN